VDDSCGAMRTHAHPHRAPLAARRYAAEAASCDPARREEMPDGCIRTGCPPICAGEPACREEIATMTQLNSLEELTLLSEVLPDDLPADLEALAAAEADLIDREPRPGAHGSVAFIHPRTLNGVLWELLQRAESKEPE